ncbi:MAG TPA: LysR family transcriptional regulator [Devosiaceae bacterium]
MDITLKQLEIFQAVVVAGSITKASRRIGLSQPSISQQLAKLEEKLGTQLIVRNRTGLVSLTPAGEYWFKAGDEMLRRLDNVVNEHRQRFIDNSVTMRIGVTPTLRGRFVAAAARIAKEEPGFVKFELTYALTSNELVEKLRLHQLNCVIINSDVIANDRSSFAVADLFDDQVAWVVPASVSAAEIRRAFAKGTRREDIVEPLRNFVEIDSSISLRARSDEWYRHTLPAATPTFLAMTYAAAIDIVAENLATAHCPISLLPNLPDQLRSKLQFFPVDISRQVVAAMPKHLMTLPAYANIFRRLVEFCRTEYNSEMSFEGLRQLPKAS